MRRGIWLAAAVLALAAAVPLWMVVADDDGDRRTGALVTVVAPAPLDCGTKEIFAGCRELSNAIESIRLQFKEFEAARGKLADAVADLQARGASPEKIKAFVTQASLDLVTQAMQRLSNVSKTQHDNAQAIISNIRA